MPLFTPSNDPQYQADLAAGKVPSRGGVPAPAPRLPGGAAGLGAAMGARVPPDMTPEGRQAKMAQAAASARASGAPPPGPGVGDPNAARYMAARQQAMSMGNPAMGSGPPPQVRPMGGPMPGPRQPAMGGAFGMKPAAPQRTPFGGGMTKAPMQAGRADPFAGGMGRQRGGNR